MIEFICTNEQCNKRQVCRTYKRDHKSGIKYIRYSGNPDCEGFEDLRYKVPKKDG